MNGGSGINLSPRMCNCCTQCVSFSSFEGRLAIKDVILVAAAVKLKWSCMNGINPCSRHVSIRAPTNPRESIKTTKVTISYEKYVMGKHGNDCYISYDQCIQLTLSMYGILVQVAQFLQQEVSTLCCQGAISRNFLKLPTVMYNRIKCSKFLQFHVQN